MGHLAAPPTILISSDHVTTVQKDFTKMPNVALNVHSVKKKGTVAMGIYPHLFDTKFIFWFSLGFKIELEKLQPLQKRFLTTARL